MESALPPPHSSPEMGPVKSGETGPNTAPKPEQALQHAPERQPQVETRETKTGPGGGGPQQKQPQAPALPPMAPPVAKDDAAQGAPAAQDDNPVAAADDDLIEKEWVDKAKKIVEETKSDPYKQELEVSKLQADYLKKRWGKEINIPND